MSIGVPYKLELDRAALRQMTVQFFGRIGFVPGDRIWLRIAWNLPTEIIPSRWEFYEKDGQRIYQHYIFCGRVTKYGFTLHRCRYAGRDAQGNTLWKLSRRRYQDGWTVAFKFSCLGATVCFYPNQPDRGISNYHVRQCRCLFYEIDDRSLSEQQAALQRLTQQTKLQPAAVIYTGGKSLHVYFRCSQPLPPEQWLQLNRKLTVLQNADPAICNPARSMRFPGMVRRGVSEGKLTRPVPITLEQETDCQYSLAELESALNRTNLFPYNLCDRRWRRWIRLVRQSKTDPAVDPLSALYEPPLPPPCLTLHQRQGEQQRTISRRQIAPLKRRASGAAIPLLICLTKHDQDLLRQGESAGNRNNAGYKLARNLLGTAQLLAETGIAYAPTAHDLFGQFCDRCSPPLDAEESAAIWQSASKAPATASRSLDSILSSIGWWQFVQEHQSRARPTRLKPRLRHQK